MPLYSQAKKSRFQTFGEALPSPGFDDAILERVLVADRVDLVRRRLAEHPAQVDEVGLRAGLFGGLDALPFGSECGWRQGRFTHAVGIRLMCVPFGN